MKSDRKRGGVREKDRRYVLEREREREREREIKERVSLLLGTLDKDEMREMW